MKRGTKKQSSGMARHPLDVLLQETAEDSKSLLGLMAQRKVEAVRDQENRWFEESINKKIESLRYRPPHSKKDGQTFKEILKRSGVLEKFLSRSLQREIEKWVLLRDILQVDRKNKQEGRSDEGFPAQFHRSMMTAMLDHLETIQEVAEKHNSQKGVENYYSRTRREFIRHAKLLMSFNRPPSWPELLGEAKLPFSPRDEQIAIRGRIFLLLKTKLQNPKSEKLGISDQFLRQLTERLMSIDAGAQLTGDRIRYAVNSRTTPGNNSQKSQKS